MSDNKTIPTGSSVDAFLASIADDRKRADCEHLRAVMESLSGEPAVMWGPSIVGCGTRSYRYESGRDGTTAAVSFAPRASNIALYVNGGLEQHAPILDRLGKYKTGKSCIYIKSLTDIDEGALRDLIMASLQYSTTGS